MSSTLVTVNGPEMLCGYTLLTLDPVDYTLRFPLQLLAKLFNVAIYHFLIDLKTAGRGVKIEKSPPNLP
jgi:hypothetical protein